MDSASLEAATEKHDVFLRQVHVEDGGRVRYRKTCEIDGQVLTEDEIGKGYGVSKDAIIPITDQDLADGPVAAKPYVLLRKALERNEKVAVAKFALRGRERLGLLRPLGGALLLSGLHWGDEIRSSEEVTPPEIELTDDEIDGALELMETMTVGSLTGLDVPDHYTEALHEVTKAEHRAPKAAEGEEKAPAPVVDLMAALEKSVADARERRGESAGGGEATVREMPKPKKKTAAKKATAKKTAQKKTTRRKTACPVRVVS
ncbi:Ku protein [Streptomyces zaomyceticus]|uniref:Ku protein n=1 Tax=Streptomyces zaomyceticus TaxID=68286 RepID=UPI003724566A